MKPPIAPDSKTSTERMPSSANRMAARDGATIAGNGSQIGLHTRAKSPGVCGKWITTALGLEGWCLKLVGQLFAIASYSVSNLPAAAFKFFTQFICYCTCFCAVVLSACAYTLAHQVRANLILDPHIVATLALAGFFGLFCFMMAITALRFVFTNQTNIDILKKQVTYQIAVRVPLGTPPTSTYHTITYPLPKPEQRLDGEVNGAARVLDKTSSRDALARKTFAILKTEPGENPWHLGYRKNFQSVMGKNIFDYLFPITGSPCTNHEDEESDYPFGPLLEELKIRHGLARDTGPAESDDGIELQQRRRGSRRR